MKLSQQILQDELVIFEKEFREAVKSQVPLLDRIMEHVELRPEVGLSFVKGLDATLDQYFAENRIDVERFLQFGNLPLIGLQ